MSISATPTVVVPPSGGNIISGSGNTAGVLTEFPAGTFVLAGGNNITLSQSSNSISIIGGAGGAGFAAGVSNIGNTSGVTKTVGNQLVLAGGNNVTLSQSTNAGGVTVTISAANAAAGTGNLFASSNTFGTSSGTYDGRTLSIAGAGAVSVAASNSGFIISAPTQTNQQGTLFASSNTFGTSSGTYDARSLSIAGSGAVSVAASNSGWVISAPTQTNQSLGIFASSQTTGAASSSTVDARSMSFVGAGNVSVGMQGGSIVISGAAGGQTNQAGTVFAASNTFGTSSGTYDARTLSMVGSGAVSVAASNSGWVISAPVQTNQSIGIFAASQSTAQSSSSTVDARSLSFAGMGNVSVGMSAGSIIISGPAASTITQGNMVTISTAGSTVTIDAFANIISASGNTVGTIATFSSGTMVLAGGANVTLSQSSNTITISAGGGAGVSTGSLFASSNTFGTSSGTFNISNISIAGSGAVGVAASNSGWVISAPTQTVDSGNLFVSSNSFGTSSGTYSVSRLSLAGSGAILIAASNSGFIISAPVQTNQSVGVFAGSNTTVSTSGTVDARSLSIAGAGAISVEASNSGFTVSSPVQSFLIAGTNISLSSNSNSITISALLPMSQYEPWEFGPNSSASSLGVSSLYFQHMEVPGQLQVCRMNRLISLSLNAAVSGSTVAEGTRSNVWTYNETVGLYTRGSGTNSTNLYSYMSNSWSFGITESVSVFSTQNIATAGLAQSYTLGFPGNIDTNGGVTTSTFTSASSTQSAGVTVSQANIISNVSGLLRLDVPFGSTLLSAGDYWLAVVGRTATTTGGTSTNLGSVSNIVLTNFNAGLQRLGQTATATSNTLVAGNGCFTVQTSAFPSSVAINAISNNSNASLYGNFMNVSL